MDTNTKRKEERTMNEIKKPQLKETLLEIKDRYTLKFIDSIGKDFSLHGAELSSLYSDFIMDIKKVYDICVERGRF